MVEQPYKTGEAIPTSGIYTVVHEEHRLPHEVTLLKGETFPRCAKCGNLVKFLLMQAVECDRSNASVRVYALPDLDDENVNPLRLGIP
jgi:YjzC-like protein